VVTGRCQGWVGNRSIHFPLSLGKVRSPHVYINQRLQIVYSSWWWAMCRSKHVEPSKNFGIINFITRLHLVCISTVQNISLRVFINFCIRFKKKNQQIKIFQ
jgi:hypothetical protein